MTCELNDLMLQIRIGKKKLADLYESKGKTDFDVLKQGDEVDRLINEFTRITRRKAS